MNTITILEKNEADPKFQALRDLKQNYMIITFKRDHYI